MSSSNNQLINVQPEELRFQFELEKQSYCDLKLANNTEHHVAFKVKTTSPKKYFVRPNNGVIQPWDSCIITVTLQAQQEYPHDIHCKDKFLLQSTIVPPNTDVDEIPQDTFNKDGEKAIEECKLRVVYTYLDTSRGNLEGEQVASQSSKQSFDTNFINAVQKLREERDAVVRQNHQLQQELEMLRRRRRNQNTDSGFSLTFSAFVGLTGIIFGFLLRLIFSAPPTE